MWAREAGRPVREENPQSKWPSLRECFFFIYIYIYIYLFVCFLWLCRVLVSILEIFSLRCDVEDL